MSIGTLYVNEKVRGILPKALVQHLGLDIEIKEPDAVFEKTFPHNKIPAFIGQDGFAINEIIAVSLYCK